MVETRKIQVTGGSTFIISIPGQWVRENGMDKGSSVAITQEKRWCSGRIHMTDSGNQVQSILQEMDGMSHLLPVP